MRLFICFAVVAVLASCSSGIKPYEHRVVGGSVNVSDVVKKSERGADASETYKVQITPTTAPGAVVASSQPSARLTVAGQEIAAPPGASVSVEIERKGIRQPDTYEHNVSGVGFGATLSTNAPDGTAKFNSDAPDFKFGGVKGETGGIGVDGGTVRAALTFLAIVDKFTASSRGAFFLMMLGGVGMLASVLVFWWKGITEGIVCLAVGFVVVLTGVLVDHYPFVVLLLPLAFVGAAIVWYRTQVKKKALTAVVAGVESAPVQSAADVKEAIGDNGGSSPAVKSLINKVKGAL